MLIRFFKPFAVLCQFRAVDGRATLADYIPQRAVHPAGRLDFDSEGLVLLTDDGSLQARIAEPRHKLPKTYLVQVEARPDPATLEDLAGRFRAGVELRDGLARAVALRRAEPGPLPLRVPAVTPHRAARSSWVEVVLTEGRNRQVRRMLAAVGMPVLRLVRTAIGPIGLQGLQPGEWEIIEPPALWRGSQAPVRRSTAASVTRRGRRDPRS
jgi:23S rRNA pseudouridine2457 synthase